MTSTPTAAAEKGTGAPAKAGRTIDYQEYALVGVVILLLIAGGILEGSSFLSKDISSTCCARAASWACSPSA